MAWPILDTLERVARFVPSELVSAATFERIRGQARRMPGTWSSYYIECRMGIGEEEVDFLASVGTEARDETASSSLEWAPSWTPWRSLCAEWGNPQSVLHRQVPALWVELDRLDQSDDHVPSICLCVSRNYIRRTSLSRSTHAGMAAAERSVQLLAREAIDAAVLECFQRTVAALPPEGELIHLSLMLGRVPVALKVYVAVPAPRLNDYLDTVVPDARIEPLLGLVARSGVRTDPVYLDLTIGARASRRIGFAFSQLHLKAREPVSSSWTPLLEACVEAGVCCPQKASALASWVGRERMIYPGEAWPVWLQRYLDIKLVSEPGDSLKAKAYLGFHPRAGLL